MSSFWHQILVHNLGQFSPDNRFIGLDYGNLFLDAQKAKLALFHELSHSLLSGTTEFGQATEKIYQFFPRFKHLVKDDKKEIVTTLREKQIFVQEGTATLMQLLMLRREIGPKDALIWAQRNLPVQYYEWVKPLLFVLDMSEKHRNMFTQKIPHLAMNTAIRKYIVELELLKNASILNNYFSDEENCPDYRFNKIISAIKNDCFLVLKDAKEICSKAGIKNFECCTKEEVAIFINYVFHLADINHTIQADQINNPDEQGKLIMNQATDKIIVGNLNLKLSETATILPTIKDILHYADDIEVVFITFLEKDIKLKLQSGQMCNKKIELGCVFQCKNGNKFISFLSKQDAINLLNDSLLYTTFVVKWGLYNFGQTGILSIAEFRIPDVVIYNTIEDLMDKLNKYDNKSEIKYFHFGATEDSPLQGLVLKDSLNILHLVNTFGNKKISNFIANNNLVKMNISEIESEQRHFNNISSFWLGLDWRIDWYKVMLKNEDVYYR